jgi:hypothetical protein
MSNSSDETTSDLDEATAKFVALENYRRLKSSLGKNDGTGAMILTFQDLWSAAKYPDQNIDLIAAIEHDRQHAGRFDALLRSMAVFTQPAQAAAASDNMYKRTGEQFDLELKPSSRQDGAYFLIIRIHNSAKIIPQHLYCCHNDSYHFITLSSIQNGVSQVMVGESNSTIDAFNDPAAEFFIK